MHVRWPTFTVWALVAASAVFWSRLIVRPGTSVQAPAASAPLVPSAALDLTRLLGADAPPAAVAEISPPEQTRMRLIGVVSSVLPADANPAESIDGGVALIAIDGQPAKAFRVGMVVEGETVLQAVEARGAKLGPRGGATLLALSVAPAPDAGTFGAAAAAAANATAAMPVAAPGSFGAAPRSANGARTTSFAAPPAMAAPIANVAPAGDGSPQAFPGPPQAFGGAPTGAVPLETRRAMPRQAP